MKKVFESDRILFVQVCEDLIPNYLEMLNDEKNVGRFISLKDRKYTEEGEKKWVAEKIDSKAFVYSMIEKDSGAFIGNIEIMDIAEGSGELGIAITKSKQEKGYGTEAIERIKKYGFSILNLHRIWLKVYSFNPRAMHVYEKCGFLVFNYDEDTYYMDVLR